MPRPGKGEVSSTALSQRTVLERRHGCCRPHLEHGRTRLGARHYHRQPANGNFAAMTHGGSRGGLGLPCVTAWTWWGSSSSTILSFASRIRLSSRRSTTSPPRSVSSVVQRPDRGSRISWRKRRTVPAACRCDAANHCGQQTPDGTIDYFNERFRSSPGARERRNPDQTWRSIVHLTICWRSAGGVGPFYSAPAPATGPEIRLIEHTDRESSLVFVSRLSPARMQRETVAQQVRNRYGH